MKQRKPGIEAMLREKYPSCIVMSARRPEDVARLHGVIVAFFQKILVEDELFCPGLPSSYAAKSIATVKYWKSGLMKQVLSAASVRLCKSSTKSSLRPANPPHGSSSICPMSRASYHA